MVMVQLYRGTGGTAVQGDRRHSCTGGQAAQLYRGTGRTAVQGDRQHSCKGGQAAQV
jgi:hypothetical protein